MTTPEIVCSFRTKLILVMAAPAVALTILLWLDWLPPRFEGMTQLTSVGSFIVLMTGVATCVGSGIAALLIRRLINALPGWLLILTSLTLVILLRLHFDTLQSWPLADVGFVLTWIAVVSLLQVALLFAASVLKPEDKGHSPDAA